MGRVVTQLLCVFVFDSRACLLFLFCLFPIYNFYCVASYGKPAVRVCSLSLVHAVFLLLVYNSVSYYLVYIICSDILFMVIINGFRFCWCHTALLHFLQTFSKPSIIFPFVLILAQKLFLKKWAAYFGYCKLAVLAVLQFWVEWYSYKNCYYDSYALPNLVAYNISIYIFVTIFSWLK